MLHFMLYPCPENEPDVGIRKTENRDRMILVTSSGSNRLASSSEQSVVLDQCRIHMSPKLPPTARSIALACNKTLERSQCFRIKTNPRDRRTSHNHQRSKRPFLRCRNNNRATASGLDSPRKSSSTMSMNVSVQKTEVREQRSDVLSLLAS